MCVTLVVLDVACDKVCGSQVACCAFFQFMMQYDGVGVSSGPVGVLDRMC